MDKQAGNNWKRIMEIYNQREWNVNLWKTQSIRVSFCFFYFHFSGLYVFDVATTCGPRQKKKSQPEMMSHNFILQFILITY